MKDPAVITALNHLGSFKKHFVMCLNKKKIKKKSFSSKRKILVTPEFSNELN